MSHLNVNVIHYIYQFCHQYDPCSYARQTLPRGPAAGASGLQEAAGGDPELQGVQPGHRPSLHHPHLPHATPAQVRLETINK